MRRSWFLLVVISSAGLLGVGCPQLTATFSRTGSPAPATTRAPCHYAVYTVRPQAQFTEVGFLTFDIQGAATTEGPRTLAAVRRLADAAVCRAGGNGLLLAPANDLGMFKTATILKVRLRATSSGAQVGTRRAVGARRAPPPPPMRNAWPDSVPFLTQLRMGQTKKAIARALLGYVRQGLWRPGEIRAGHRVTHSRAASGGPEETDIGPETITAPVRALPWPGRRKALSGLRGEIELRFTKGRLTKVRLRARGVTLPASFTKPRLAAYLRRLNPKLRIRVAEGLFKMKGKAGRFEVEVEYEPRDGGLEIEVEQELGE